jgi:hypothetical protein
MVKEAKYVRWRRPAAFGGTVGAETGDARRLAVLPETNNERTACDVFGVGHVDRVCGDRRDQLHG